MTMKTNASNSAPLSKNKAKTTEPWMTFKKRKRTPKVLNIRSTKPKIPNTQDLKTPQQTNLQTKRTNRNTQDLKTPQQINLQTKRTNRNTQESKTPQRTKLQIREQPQPQPQPQPEPQPQPQQQGCLEITKLCDSLPLPDNVQTPQRTNLQTREQPEQQWCLEITKLCDSLPLPDNVRSMVQKFLEFTLNNYKTYTEPVSILKAFQLSLATASELTSKAAVGFPSTVRSTDCPEDATPLNSSLSQVTSVSRPGNPTETQQVQVQSPPSPVKLLPANRSDHVSMVMELPERAQKLPYADCSNLSLSLDDHVKSNRKFSGASGMLQDSGVTQQLHQHSRQQNATLPFLVPSSRGSLAATLQNSHTSAGSHTMVHDSRNLQAGLEIRAHDSRNLQAGLEIRAHAPHLLSYGPSGNHQAGLTLAPHLLSYRPSTFVPVPYFSEVSHGMPSSSSFFPGFPRSMPTAISQVGTQRGHVHENTRWFNTVTLLDIMNANNMR